MDTEGKREAHPGNHRDENAEENQKAHPYGQGGKRGHMIGTASRIHPDT